MEKDRALYLGWISVCRFSFGKHSRDVAREDSKCITVLHTSCQSWRRMNVNHLVFFFGTIPIESAGEGNERFTSGTKRGQTFRRVARVDPSSETGYNPDPDQMGPYCSCERLERSDWICNWDLSCWLRWAVRHDWYWNQIKINVLDAMFDLHT